jgi:hypothetical protein
MFNSSTMSHFTQIEGGMGRGVCQKLLSIFDKLKKYKNGNRKHQLIRGEGT